MNQPMKSPGVAAVLSFFWMGLGQIYNGQIGKGIILMILEGILLFLSIITFGVLYILLFAVWVWNIINAYKTAESFNVRLTQKPNSVASSVE